MSHTARRSRAPSPDAAVALAAGEVRRAFSEWASALVALLVRDYVPTVARPADRQDATIAGLLREAGRAKPRAEKLEQAFRMLDRQSADELRVAGVPTADVVPKAEQRKAEWLRANTDLIKAEADLRRRVERVLEDPLNQGRSVADISKLLQEQAGYSTSRAELTARDQTLKLYGQIQQERQQNAGVERYIWTTSLDERVRPDHADLDGSIQRWDDPPIVDRRTGRRGHPGFDYQCRCSAVAVLDEPAEGEAPAEQQRQTELRQRAVEAGRFVPPPQRPPPEPAMRPSAAELAAERQRVAAERAATAERLRLEREADARIAAARAEAQRLEAERQAAQQLEIARREAEAVALERAREAERQRIAAAVPPAPPNAPEKPVAPRIAAERLGLTENELSGFLLERGAFTGGRVALAEVKALPGFEAWYDRKAIERYTENSAFLVNRKLRTVGWNKSWAPAGSSKVERRYYEGLKTIARRAGEAMARNATNTRPLFRGTLVPDDLLASWTKAGAVSDPAFMSFSTSPSVAQRFLPGESVTGQFAENRQTRVLIRAPEGGGYHYGGAEAEVMFPPDSKLPIRSVTREGGVVVIEVGAPVR